MTLLDRLRVAIGDKRHAYRTVFKGPHAETVLKDLAIFCRAHKPTFEADPRVHAAFEGRREVWLKIQEMLNLTTDELWALYIERNTREG